MDTTEPNERLVLCAKAFRNLYKLQIKVRSLKTVLYGTHNNEELIVALVKDPSVKTIFPGTFLGYKVIVDVVV